MSDLAYIAAELEKQLLIIQAGLEEAQRVIAAKDAEIESLHRVLKQERDYSARLKQRSGAGRWM